jgi:hypothetical protein
MFDRCSRLNGFELCCDDISNVLHLGILRLLLQMFTKILHSFLCADFPCFHSRGRGRCEFFQYLAGGSPVFLPDELPFNVFQRFGHALNLTGLGINRR